jgi:hypothetical protein
MGLKRTDVLFLAKLPKEKMLEIYDLIFGSHWMPKMAVDFINDMPDEHSTVRDLISWCLGTKDKFYTAEVLSGAFTVTCKGNRRIPREKSGPTSSTIS